MIFHNSGGLSCVGSRTQKASNRSGLEAPGNAAQGFPGGNEFSYFIYAVGLAVGTLDVARLQSPGTQEIFLAAARETENEKGLFLLTMRAFLAQHQQADPGDARFPEEMNHRKHGGVTSGARAVTQKLQ